MNRKYTAVPLSVLVALVAAASAQAQLIGIGDSSQSNDQGISSQQSGSQSAGGGIILGGGDQNAANNSTSTADNAQISGGGLFVGATGLCVGRLFLRPEWKKETVIGTLALCQTLGHLLKVIAYGTAGFTVFTQMDFLLPLVVAVIAGTAAGRVLNRHLSEELFRRLFKALLLGLSLKLIFDSAVGLGWIAWS